MTGERLDLPECYPHNSCSLCIFKYMQTHIWTPLSWILLRNCLRDTLTVTMFGVRCKNPSNDRAGPASFIGFFHWLSSSAEHAEIQPNCGVLVECKSAQQMRPEQPPGYILNFGFAINQGYCHAGRRITCAILFFNHFSGRLRSVFMATTGRS